MKKTRFVVGCFWLFLVTATTFAQDAPAVHVKRVTYEGWPDSLVVGNGQAEILVVPKISRVMGFYRVGEEGPFWRNAKFFGAEPKWEADKWMNFGGDKSWPAPQADWPRIAGSGWPPPTAFDSMPSQAEVIKNGVELLSPVDAHYGIRVRRRITLDPSRSEMSITTTFEKISGEPLKVSVWTISQLKDPQRVFAPVVKTAPQPKGYVQQSKDAVPDLRVENNLISFTRSSRLYLKIGTPADVLYWTDGREALRIKMQKENADEFPDNGSSAEIYTNPDPDKYVELEMLGPLSVMKNGDRKSLTAIYTLLSHEALVKELKIK
ncbi:MAG TPA: hypothetical protein VM870_07275 [Pyrinomonadaceae bacterium]|jgi:hypothetical protein|nr:hypothetical protein [Pyrinomonadaceae bacterium]